MKTIAWDTETALIRPGRLAPELACLSYQVLENDKVGEAHLVDRHEAGALMRMWLSDPNILLVGQNVAYDVAVMIAAFPDLKDAFFRAYDDSRFADTLIREQLIMIACGRFKGWLNEAQEWVRPRFDLEALAKRHAGMILDKDTWRLRYGEFILPNGRGQDLKTLCFDNGLAEDAEIPLALWPEGARTYPKQDAVATLAVYIAQEDAKQYIPDQFNQVRFALWKHLTSCRGLKTDAASVLRFKAATEEELVDVEERLREAGLVRKDGTRDTKKAKERMIAVCEAENIPLRKTKSDGVALDADACENTDDDLLMDYAQFTTLSAMLNKDVPMLLAGVKEPIHTRFGMAESGRTTSSSNKALGAGTGNLQNLRRGAKKKKGETDEEFKARKKRSGDIRQCFIPRPGCVFLQADYEQLELRTLAQTCITLFGHSKLGEALNAGRDPHMEVAARILKKDYEWMMANKEVYEVENSRQVGKVASFGFPGGLGAKNLVKFARKTYGVILTEDEAKDLKRIWTSVYPEMVEFFAHVGDLGEGIVTQLFSNRIRGGATYCAKCNTFFQGLGADASQNAGWQICKACYVDTSSPLYGGRIVNYVHDEYFIEFPEGPGMHEAAMELERLMVLGAKAFVPDVDISAPPMIMRCWSKGAKATYDENRRLIPWSPA